MTRLNGRSCPCCACGRRPPPAVEEQPKTGEHAAHQEVGLLSEGRGGKGTEREEKTCSCSPTILIYPSASVLNRQAQYIAGRLADGQPESSHYSSTCSELRQIQQRLVLNGRAKHQAKRTRVGNTRLLHCHSCPFPGTRTGQHLQVRKALYEATKRPPQRRLSHQLHIVTLARPHRSVGVTQRQSHARSFRPARRRGVRRRGTPDSN